MNCGVLFCLLLSHVISEFVFQPSRVARLKDSPVGKDRALGNTIHAGIYLSVSIILIIFYWSPFIFWLIPVLSIGRGLLGFAKSWGVSKYHNLKYSFLLFLIDQLFQITLIGFIAYWISKKLPVKSWVFPWVNQPTVFFHSCFADITYNEKILLSLVLLIIGLWGVGALIPGFFNRMKLNKRNQKGLNFKIEFRYDNQKDGAPHGGLIIGILERLFIICAIVLGIAQKAQMVQIIGFVLATKSVARFKEFDDRDFVEYFIIGSFISFTSAILIGVAIRALLYKN